MRDSQIEEVIYLFTEGQITSELLHDSFDQHIERRLPIEGVPAETALREAVYVAIGPEFRIQGLVFFLLQVDELGRPDKKFNIPLPYLAKNAGAGPDLGYGPVPMACRGSCSVPWHANNLWDPLQESETNPIGSVVAAVRANSLGLNLVAPAPLELDSEDVSSAAQIAELRTAHKMALIDLKNQHEQELKLQRELLEAKVDIYSGEISRLKMQLARQA